MKAEDIINLALEMMLKEHRAMEHPERDRVSRKAALKKYAGLVDEWEQRGLLPRISSVGGKATYYPKHRLEELWMVHMMGKEALL